MAQRNPAPLGTPEWLRTFRFDHAWRQLSKQVRREEPTCWLRLPGCTHLSTTADHVLPAATHPELAFVRSNLHGACRNCNSKRSDKHAYDPALRRPRPRTTTAQALRRKRKPRKPPRALRFFNASIASNNGSIASNNGASGQNNGTQTMAPTPQTMATTPKRMVQTMATARSENGVMAPPGETRVC